MNSVSTQMGPVGQIRSAFKWIARWLFRPKTIFLNSEYTRLMIQRYCHGRGIEIGPGANPQAPAAQTWYVDRYRTYHGRRMGVDVVADAGTLPFAEGSLDYIVSSHVLEHTPNTLPVLRGWRRALKPGGRLLLRLPHRDRTFDRLRALTPLEHHIADEAAGVDYTDPTHWQDYLEHAIDIFPHSWKEEARQPDGSYDIDFIVKHGHLHYHVWTQHEIVLMLLHVGFRILFVADQVPDRDDSFLVVVEVPA